MRDLFSFDPMIPVHPFEFHLEAERSEQHWHSFYEIGYCLAGRGTFFFGDEIVPVQAGTLLFFPPYAPHIAIAEGQRECKCVFIYFEESLLPARHEQLLHVFFRPGAWEESELRRRQPGMPQLAPFFRAMLSEYSERREAYDALLRARMLELCVWLYRAEEGMMSSPAWRKRHAALARLKPALHYLAEQFHDPIELRDVAQRLGLSESRARHMFIEGLGLRFKEYLTFIRIQETKRLLTTSELPVTDIYLSCGFQSAAPFYRSFRQLVGMSPQKYRARRQ